MGVLINIMYEMQAAQREEAYEENIRDLTERLKAVRNIASFTNACFFFSTFIIFPFCCMLPAICMALTQASKQKQTYQATLEKLTKQLAEVCWYLLML